VEEDDAGPQAQTETDCVTTSTAYDRFTTNGKVAMTPASIRSRTGWTLGVWMFPRHPVHCGLRPYHPIWETLLPWTAENKLLGPLCETLGAGCSEHSVNLRNNAS
jgi:hypothetical protein